MLPGLSHIAVRTPHTLGQNTSQEIQNFQQIIEFIHGKFNGENLSICSIIHDVFNRSETDIFQMIKSSPFLMQRTLIHFTVLQSNKCVQHDGRLNPDLTKTEMLSLFEKSRVPRNVLEFIESLDRRNFSDLKYFKTVCDQIQLVSSTRPDLVYFTFNHVEDLQNHPEHSTTLQEVVPDGIIFHNDREGLDQFEILRGIGGICSALTDTFLSGIPNSAATFEEKKESEKAFVRYLASFHESDAQEALQRQNAQTTIEIPNLGKSNGIVQCTKGNFHEALGTIMARMIDKNSPLVRIKVMVELKHAMGMFMEKRDDNFYISFYDPDDKEGAVELSIPIAHPIFGSYEKQIQNILEKIYFVSGKNGKIPISLICFFENLELGNTKQIPIQKLFEGATTREKLCSSASVNDPKGYRAVRDKLTQRDFLGIGGTPENSVFSAAIIYGHNDMAQMIFEENRIGKYLKIDVNSVTNSSKNTPLHQALLFKNITMIEFLLKNSETKLDLQNADGLTQLDIARVSQDLEIVGLIKKYRPEIEF